MCKLKFWGICTCFVSKKVIEFIPMSCYHMFVRVRKYFIGINSWYSIHSEFFSRLFFYGLIVQSVCKSFTGRKNKEYL